MSLFGFVNIFIWIVKSPVSIVQEEDEVPDDETVNQMIARSEEEFDHFMVSPVPLLNHLNHLLPE